MAPQEAPDMLRVVTQRLSSTPIKQLPHVAPYLATNIAQHGQALARSSKEDKVVGKTDSAVNVHKLKTQLSALLQDKNREARYAAVILIRATVEVGGWNVLHGVGAWVRVLVGLLGKPDHSATKKICIITLTKIFFLTREHQSLIREITTPSLPGFIAACLNLTKSSCSPQAAPGLNEQSPLLLVILHALSELITLHPTLFRPFVSQIQSLTYLLIAPTSSNSENGSNLTPTLASLSESARHLFVLLHVTGPKNTAAEEWAKSLDSVIVVSQRTANKVFRSLIEDYTSSIGSHDIANMDPMEDIVSDRSPMPLALPAWMGIHAGIERLDGLLHLLQAFLATATAAAVTLPVGNILNLVDRILSISPPGNGRNPRVRPEVGRDEREGLWVGLPGLQVSALGVCSLMISRMGHGSAAIACTILEQLLWTFESQHANDSLRMAAYALTSQILSTSGLTLPKKYAISLSRCIRMCCEDLLPSTESQLQGGEASFPDTTKAANGLTLPANPDSYLKDVNNSVDLSVPSAKVLQAARELLMVALTNLPKDFLPFSLRCQIDRTAIITNNKEVMLASVMNPIPKRRGQKQTSSILPLLARAHPEALPVEALLRPQMPPVQFRQSDASVLEPDEEDDMYMENHPQTGTSSEFYHGLAGTDGNATVERNVALGPRDVQMEATSGAAEERSPEIEPPTSVSKSTPTGLQEPKAIFSYNAKKREREPTSNVDTEEVLGGDSTDQVELGVANKRSRIDSGEREEETPLGINNTVIDNGGIGKAVKEVPFVESAAVMDGQFDVQQGDSDESDFVMPSLDLELDSDLEDEDEEEEEEEEEEVEGEEEKEEGGEEKQDE